MALLQDKNAIRALLQADRPWAVYALGDLDPEHFVHARWYAHGRSIVMLYRAFRPPVLFALGDVAPVLDEIPGEAEFELHVRPEVVDSLRQRRWRVSEKPMWRMHLDRTQVSLPATTAVRLTSTDVAALERLYADGNATGEQPHFFLPSM